jgi:glycosyltransferase involved in cell wall biosynthesis
MKFSIIVPVYNEVQTIEGILKKIAAVVFPVPVELIVVNDGSSDGTIRQLEEIIQRPEFAPLIRLVSYPDNRGKGFAIRSGLREASGELLAIQDADLEYNPAELVDLIQPILKGRAEVVYGSRFKGKIKEISFSHRIGNIVLTVLTNLLFGSRLTDMETCYKLFTRKVYEAIKLTEDRFEIEAEITAQILKGGFQILELPITYQARGKKAGKKISWRDGLNTAWRLIGYRFQK